MPAVWFGQAWSNISCALAMRRIQYLRIDWQSLNICFDKWFFVSFILGDVAYISLIASAIVTRSGSPRLFTNLPVLMGSTNKLQRMQYRRSRRWRFHVAEMWPSYLYYDPGCGGPGSSERCVVGYVVRDV